jgi:phosphatidylinositol kinase/protein kinase (PI-3  family)
MVGYVEDHSPKTYKVFKYVPNGPGEVIITRNVKWEHWYHPYKSQSSVSQLSQSAVSQPPALEQPAFTRVEGLNPQQQELMEKMIDDYIVEKTSFVL